MVSLTLLAGGYSAAIASYSFNPDAGSLTLLAQNPSGMNPSWIGAHATNASILYAVNENDDGAVQSFLVGANGTLSAAISTVPSGGGAPAHLAALKSGKVSVMNYSGGNGRILSTAADDATVLRADTPVITFNNGGASHPHETYELACGTLLVPDLGADHVWTLSADGAGAFAVNGSLAQPAGSGPRHVQVVGDLLFTLHEVANTLTVQRLDSADVLASASVLPPDAAAGATFGAGEIAIPPTSDAFPEQYIYVTNRNVSPDAGLLDPRGDTIAIFSFDSASNTLTNVQQVYTGIRQIRGLAFSGGAGSGIDGAGDAEYVAAGGVVGAGGVAVFRRTEGGKNLEEVARNTDIETRTSFVWL